MGGDKNASVKAFLFYNFIFPGSAAVAQLAVNVIRSFLEQSRSKTR